MYYVKKLLVLSKLQTLLNAHLLLFNAVTNVDHVLPPFSVTLSSPFSHAARQS